MNNPKAGLRMGFPCRATPPGVAGMRYKQKDRVPIAAVIARSEATRQSVLFPAPFRGRAVQSTARPQTGPERERIATSLRSSQ